ncbi:MAG: phosphoribosyl-AMP cyclohydrolase [Acidobacteria bacterium]|nr:phosphoribosyl-AMP cyclohydrolase [Acidobacteriota bacterium]MCB9398041.1 phosphoribosyl-AMP cyclohydrolase [Acidobacteriota bacterium]
MLIPSIDLFDGKAVQWRQGKEAVLERSDVFDLFDEFSLLGEVALIDLNAATNRGSNRELILELLKKRPCRVGGGIRDLETARTYLKAGASRLILGTAAREPWVEKLPANALIFAIDAKGDHLLSHGWQTESQEDPRDLLQPLAQRCSEFLYTQVEKEGMLQGLDRVRVETIVKASPIPVTVAGGITDLDDITFLRRLGANAQIGMALYTGRFSLTEAFLTGLKWPDSGLMPTMVQEVEGGTALMLAYSNRDSLKQAIETRKATYFSRSRNQLWVKGETSGHTQALVGIEADCDGDTLLFKVRQTGMACHLNRPSCFPQEGHRFRLENLDQVIAGRKVQANPQSFTAKLFADPAFLASKLTEECQELIEAQTFDEVRWEAADLIYFALVRARAAGVSLADIEAELRSRHVNP